MLGALLKVLSSWPSKATIKLAKRRMRGGLISVFAAMQAPISPKIIGEIDAMWAHAEQFFPSWGCTPESQKFPSAQLQSRHERIQVDELAVSLEGVMPVQQDVP
ncbi:hypothetical protein, partial [Pseudomonas lundensis]|uniref:hypothetical protein n=1 Tax=Pseudomonas lundensis TaxID=86185 RepID=UPI0016AADA12